MSVKIPEWLQKSRAADSSRHIHEAPDGTFAVWIEFGEHEPILGVPTRDMAQQIVDAMWEMESAGASNAMLSYRDD